jgi:hypothetical protein
MMHITVNLLKGKDVTNVLPLAVRQKARGLYVKVTVWRCITSDPIGPDHSLTLKLGLLIVQRIAGFSPNGHS